MMMLHDLRFRTLSAMLTAVLFVAACSISVTPSPAAKSGISMVSAITNNPYKAVLDYIAECEGTAGAPNGAYAVSLDYGRWLPDGKEQELTKLTIDQIDELQTYMLANPMNRARYGNGIGSSAIGKYQIVRATLRRLKKRLDLTGSELFDEAMQDRLAAELVRGRGANTSLGREWASLRGKKLTRAIDLVRQIKP
ncbi:hypothetical protein MKK55_26775 [Methylobacterium sp. J-059]|uniref:hypothetical protein n=1 Tax=Methylobacterium sp. J-059 TaxID=2836643 RepID=UPI001FBA460D|nr:hypothetical protein [Methylobacterium sp. J-059]MCJ2042524.1 hypothetical protein [Methylobacterium sp. J-059]